MKVTGIPVVFMTLGLLAGCEFSNHRTRPETPPAAAPVAQDPEMLERAAKDAYDRGDWVPAEQQYLALTAKVTTAAEPWFRLGNIYARTRRPDLAIRAFQEAVRRDPKHARAWHNMGVVQLQQAISSFSAVEEVASKDDPLYPRSVELRQAVQALLAPRSPDRR